MLPPPPERSEGTPLPLPPLLYGARSRSGQPVLAALGTLPLAATGDPAGEAARGGGDGGIRGREPDPSPKSKMRAVASITSHAKAITCTLGQNWPVEMARHAPAQPVAIDPAMVSMKTWYDLRIRAHADGAQEA